MFYAFIKHVGIMFLIISCICSIPILIINNAQVTYGGSLAQFDTFDYANLYPVANSTYNASTYATRTSVGTVFRNPYNATFLINYSKDTKSNLFRGDIITYLNIVGVLYVLIHSIILRRILVRMSIELDKKEVSPSDFAIVVRNIPSTMNKDQLKAELE